MLLGRSLLGSTWNELRRRKVVRSAAAYAVVAFVVLQLAEITYDPLGLPGWALTWTVLGAILGFPIVLVLAWFFDFTAHGIARDTGRAGAAGAAFAVIVVLLSVGGVGFWLSTVYTPGEATTAAAATTSGRAEPTSDAPANAIAVLPFDDMSPERDQRHLADGIAEELLDRLARLQGLRVAARTSSFALRAFAGDVREVGRLLNVRWVVEGSVRKDAGRVRITAQLIDAADGYHAWSETYERPDQDLFALQDEVTAAIAYQLAARVGGVGGRAEGEMSTRDPQALELYLQGRQAWRQRGPAALEQAAELFQQALALDPDFAHAWSGLADTYLLQADYGLRPLDQAIALAEPAAVKAVTLRPTLGEAWASIGLLRTLAGQLEPARRSLEEAIRLDPRYEMALMWLAGIYGRQGQPQQQSQVLQQALELSPLEPVINVNLAGLLAERGDFDGARAHLARVLAIRPDDPLLLRTLAEVELGAGRLEPALRLAREAHALDPSAPANLLALAQALAILEDFAGAEALVRQLPEANDQRAVALQQLRLRQGDGTLVPELHQRIAPLLTASTHPTPRDREALAVAGMAGLLAGRPDEAATLLRVAAGTTEQLAEDFSRLTAASLLLVALQASTDTAEVARWTTAVLDTAARWEAHAGDGGGVRYLRALQRLYAGDREAALATLEAAVAAGFRERWLLRFDPRLAPLRDAPRVVELERRLGEQLAQARRAVGLEAAP